MNIGISGSDATNSRGLALVTGASRGIGRSIAQRLGRDGWTVAITYATKSDEAKCVAEEISRSGGKAFYFRADVGRSEDVKGLFAEIGKLSTPLKVVVNNAGVNTERPVGRATASNSPCFRGLRA